MAHGTHDLVHDLLTSPTTTPMEDVAHTLRTPGAPGARFRNQIGSTAADAIPHARGYAPPRLCMDIAHVIRTFVRGREGSALRARDEPWLLYGRWLDAARFNGRTHNGLRGNFRDVMHHPLLCKPGKGFCHLIRRNVDIDGAAEPLLHVVHAACVPIGQDKPAHTYLTCGCDKPVRVA
jgi:hypothetical protein